MRFPRPDAAALRKCASVFAAVTALGALAQASGRAGHALLAYRRAAVLDGEVWRLATGPWVHLSWAHLLLNLGGFACVLLMFARLVDPVRQLLVLIAAAALTGALLMIGDAHASWMVGLSGPLHGLFAFCAASLIAARDPAPSRAWWQGPRFGWVLLAGLALKTGVEFALRAHADRAASAWLGGPVLVEAHLAGALAGLLLWPAWRLLSAQDAVAAQSGPGQRE